MHQVNFNETSTAKATWELHKNSRCCFEQIQEAAPHKTAAVRSLTSHFKNYPKTNTKGTFSYEILHIDGPVLADYQGLTYISSAQTLDAVYRT